jgi:hypothetical protein
MNTPNNDKMETCRLLAAELNWNEKHAESSARIVMSKALWSGLEIEQVVPIICSLPSANYIRHNLHILIQTCAVIHQKALCFTAPVDEFEALLNGE